MEAGDKIYIRNRAGKLTVELVNKLCLEDVAQGAGDDGLPSIQRPRLEFHKKHGGDRIVTLSDRAQKLPGIIYVAFLNDFEKTEIWEGRFDNGEEYELIYETEF